MAAGSNMAVLLRITFSANLGAMESMKWLCAGIR